MKIIDYETLNKSNVSLSTYLSLVAIIQEFSNYRHCQKWLKVRASHPHPVHLNKTSNEVRYARRKVRELLAKFRASLQKED